MTQINVKLLRSNGILFNVFLIHNHLISLQNITAWSQAVFFLQYSQSLCSLMTLQQRDLERATTTQLMGREKLAGLLSQFVQFQHYFFCSEESDDMCELGL